MNARIISLILNIILDYLAIRFNYGVSGVAWATVIIETIYTIIVYRLAKDTVKYTMDKNILKDLLNLTKHGVVDRIFDRGGKLVLDIILSRLGTYEYAAHVILKQIEDFANDFCYGFGIGITTNVGIKLGKNDKKEIEELKNVINKTIIALMLIVPIIMFIAIVLLLPVLIKEQEALIVGYSVAPLVVLYSLLIPIRYKYSSIISGMKELKYNAQVSIITNTLKVLLAYILCKYIGVSGAWIAFIISYIAIIFSLKRKIRISETFLDKNENIYNISKN